MLDFRSLIAHSRGMALHSYSHTALDLAMACRRAISSGDTPALVLLLDQAEGEIYVAAGVRAADRKLRTGVSSASLEEEMQALLVAVLCADPLAWSQGRVGVVDVNHSPQGAAKSRFQAAAMKRAGARAGWPDLDVRLVTPTGPHAVLLELKVGKGSESTEQRGRRKRLCEAGFDVRLVRGLLEAMLVVVNLLIGERVSSEISYVPLVARPGTAMEAPF